MDAALKRAEEGNYTQAIYHFVVDRSKAGVGSWLDFAVLEAHTVSFECFKEGLLGFYWSKLDTIEAFK